jgi:TolB-like protein/Tfp pilus assembly protein PilF
LSQLLDELKKRNVIRVALMYLSVAWLLAQLITTLDDLVGLPEWTGTLLLIVLAIGFVVALVLSWHFDLTADGIRSETDIRSDPAAVRLPARYLDFVIMALLVLALGYFVWESRFRHVEGEAGQLYVAVLPVRDISAAKDQAWFAAGLTEELIRALVAIPALSVIGRSTVAQFDPATLDARDFGATIGATHVIDSSINSDGSKVRINAALVRVADGISIWSDAFIEEPSNFLRIQDRLARHVSHSLEVHLRGADDSDQLPGHDAGNFGAYQAYLKGRYSMAKRTPGDLQAAIEFFRASLELDPTQSSAHSSLAAVYAFSQFYSSSVDPIQLAVLTQRHAREAISIDETNAEAHAILGTAFLLFERDWDAARAELGRAYELAPGDADILNAYGDYFYYIGDFRSALEYERRAAELDPLSATNQLELGLVYGFLNRFDLALQQAGLAVELNPELANAHWQMFRLRFLAGDIAAARSVLAEYSAEMGPSFLAQARIRLAMADGRTSEAVDIALERELAAKQGKDSLSAVALMFALVGQDVQAASYVDLAFDSADGVLNSPMYFFLPEDWEALPETRAALDRPEASQLYSLRRSFRQD